VSRAPLAPLPHALHMTGARYGVRVATLPRGPAGQQDDTALAGACLAVLGPQSKAASSAAAGIFWGSLIRHVVVSRLAGNDDWQASARRVPANAQRSTLNSQFSTESIGRAPCPIPVRHAASAFTSALDVGRWTLGVERSPTAVLSAPSAVHSLDMDGLTTDGTDGHGQDHQTVALLRTLRGQVISGTASVVDGCTHAYRHLRPPPVHPPPTCQSQFR